jgi:GntR family transcriptional regulator, transcriptional repressor for pyruvate dehydrogenase complex
MDPPAGGRARPLRAFEEIVSQLEHAIRDGSLRTGDRLPAERELAHAFQVSRTSLREALRALEAIGVLRARRGQGTVSGSVVEPQRGRLTSLLALHVAACRFPARDLLEVRRDLDAMAARAAAQRRAPTHELDQLTEAMDRAESDADFVRLKCDFHGAVAHLSGNELAPLLLEALRDVLAVELQGLLEGSEDPLDARRRLNAQHAALARHIARGDAEAAGQAGAAHVRELAAQAPESSPVPARD